MSSWFQCCDVQLIPVLWWCADRTAADEPPDALPEEGVAHQGTEHCTGVHHLPGTCPSLSLLHIPCMPFLSLTLSFITYLGLIMKIMIRWSYLHSTKSCLEGLFQAHIHTHMHTRFHSYLALPVQTCFSDLDPKSRKLLSGLIQTVSYHFGHFCDATNASVMYSRSVSITSWTNHVLFFVGKELTIIA